MLELRLQIQITSFAKTKGMKVKVQIKSNGQEKHFKQIVIWPYGNAFSIIRVSSDFLLLLVQDRDILTNGDFLYI